MQAQPPAAAYMQEIQRHLDAMRPGELQPEVFVRPALPGLPAPLVGAYLVAGLSGVLVIVLCAVLYSPPRR